MAAFVQVILPDSGADLLRAELALAFAEQGLQVVRADPALLHRPDGHGSLARLLENGPSLLFSVNFQGLGQLRRTLELLEARQSRAAAWCVDNPWNLLAGVRDPRWKGMPLFVTDASFLPSLERHGASRAYHLPLAACPAFFEPNTARDERFPPPQDLAPFVFVGRSAFPGKERFFEGQSLPPPLWEKSMTLLRQGERPDFFWWESAFSPQGEATVFWPGKKGREPALGAEESSLAWRSLCLSHAAGAGRELAGASKENNSSIGLDIYGDAGWEPLLPDNARLRPPVDYYARLPGIYARSRYSLSFTSMQLPHGLNQRHFDIWMAGGVCLSDATPGLALFPKDLTRPVTFARPQDLLHVAEAVERMPGGRAALTASWRKLLLDEHTYGHRARSVLERL